MTEEIKNSFDTILVSIDYVSQQTHQVTQAIELANKASQNS